MATKKKAVKKVIHHKKVTRSVSGRHPEHIAMLYRLSGAGIVVVAGLTIIFLVKNTFNF